jgi:hypothetical protein
MRSVLGHLGTTETSLALSYGWHPTSSAANSPSQHAAEGGADPADGVERLSAGNRRLQHLRPAGLALETRELEVARPDPSIFGADSGETPAQTPRVAAAISTASGLVDDRLAQSSWAWERRPTSTAAPATRPWGNLFALAPAVDP